MGDSAKSYYDSCEEYANLCKRFNVEKREKDVDYGHLSLLKDKLRSESMLKRKASEINKDLKEWKKQNGFLPEIKEENITFQKYQKEAIKTAIYPEHLKVLYPVIGLSGEVGEVSEKIKKVYRDLRGHFSTDQKKDIIKEIGDVLWYLALICHDLNITLEEAANMNIEKLQSRQERNVLQGSGDDR